MTKMASPVGWRNFSFWRCEIKATSAKLGGIGCISQQALPQLTTLDGVGLDRIHRSFIEAFSDYQVDIDLPLEGLRSMIVRNDIALGRSVGCWVGEVVIVIWFGNQHNWPGVCIARRRRDRGALRSCR
ncbi:hypothetical protein SDC9_171529 [bioreactor metagenome]|uniref:Uncharacterized protein n=1 Tax=bioreactor metagenome TaxID=1076179 RepID=A0A645GBW4_9ZZZZ